MNAYLVRMTPFGPVALAWQPSARGAVIHHVFLSTPDRPADAALRRTYPHAGLAANADVRTVAAGIRALLRGAKVEFDLDLVALDQCPPFQHAVLQATDVAEVTGVGRKIAAQHKEADIETVLDLARLDPATARRPWSVVLERTVRELQGMPYIGPNDQPPP